MKEKLIKYAPYIMIFALSVSLLITYTKYDYMKAETAKVAKYNNDLGKELKTYKDENGKLHAKVETLETSNSAFVLQHQEYVDSVADVLNIKTKQIKGLTTLNTVLNGKIRAKVDTAYKVVVVPGETPITDTVRFYTVNFNDGYMALKAKLEFGEFTADYKVTDSLTFVSYYKKTGFLGLGAKKLFLDVTAKNPNTSFTNMSDVELKKARPKQYSVDLSVGYGWDGSKFGPSVGISVGRTLFSF